MQVRRWVVAHVFGRMFGYSRGVERTNSHFGAVEEGTEFGFSDFRFIIYLRLRPNRFQV